MAMITVSVRTLTSHILPFLLTTGSSIAELKEKINAEHGFAKQSQRVQQI